MAGRKRWSAAALARELGWAQSYMARRWDGRAAFTPAELGEVARVMDVSVDALLPAEAREVREVAGPEVLAALDLDQLERIAAALGVSVASLIPQHTTTAAGPPDPSGAGRVLRFKPDDIVNTIAERQVAPLVTAGRPLVDQPSATRSARAARPPSGPSNSLPGQTTGPGSRRPRVNARLAGDRS